MTSDTKAETKIQKLREPVIVKNAAGFPVAELESLVAQGPLGELYIGRMLNRVQLLAERIIDGEAPPSVFDLDLPYREPEEDSEPVKIDNPDLVTRIYNMANDESHKLQKLSPEERKDALELLTSYIDPHLQESTPVAIKVIRPRPDDDRMEDRLARENQLLRKLGFTKDKTPHPNIVRRYGRVRDPDLGTCIFLEYIEGETLRDYLNRQQGKKLGPKEAVSLIIKIAEAAQYVHSKGVIHRDLKPANIILRKSDGNPVLIDFGTSKDEDAEVTQAGQVMGTLTYMAPEQYTNSSKATQRCDVYSASQMLAEMLTGEHPLPLKEEKDKAAWLQKSYHHWVIRKFFPDIHPELEVLVEVGRAKKADDRFDDGEFIAQAQRVQKREWYFEPKEDVQTPSTVLKNRKNKLDARRKRLKVQVAGLAIKLQTRELEELLETVRQHEAAGTYTYAQSALGDFEKDLKDYRGNRKPFEQEIATLKTRIASGLSYQTVRDQLNAARQLTAQEAPDYAALGDALEKIKPDLDKIAQDKHSDVHKDYADLAEQFEPHRDFVSAFKSAQKTLTNITKDIETLEKNDRDGKPVNTEVLRKIPGRIGLADTGLAAVPSSITPQHDREKAFLNGLLGRYQTLADKYIK